MAVAGPKQATAMMILPKLSRGEQNQWDNDSAMTSSASHKFTHKYLIRYSLPMDLQSLFGMIFRKSKFFT